MKKQAGFTLVEALITGVISLIIPVVVIAVLTVSNTQLAANSTSLKLTQISNAIAEDVHITALKATYVYAWNEAEAGCPIGTDPVSQLRLSGVVFCDKVGNVIKGFRVVQMPSPNSHLGTMEELIGGSWNPILLAEDPVTVTWDPNPYVVKANGLFGIFPKGDFVWHNLRYDMVVAGKRTFLPVQTQSVVCRNAPSRAMSW